MVTLGRQGRQALARKSFFLSSWGRINTYWSWSWGNTSTVRLMKKHEGMKKVIYNSLEVCPANAFLVSNLWYRHGTRIYSIFATLCLHQHFRLLVGGFSGVSPVLSVLSGLFLSSRIVTHPNVQSLGTSRVLPALNHAPSTRKQHMDAAFFPLVSQKLVQKTRNCQILTLTMNNSKGSAMTDSHPNRQPVG